MMRALRDVTGGVILIVVGRLAAREKLPRNIFAGVRIPSTLRSNEAWLAGHRAAAAALTAAGFGPMVAAAAVAATSPEPAAEQTIRRIGTAWLLGWLGLATLQARRAARAVTAR